MEPEAITADIVRESLRDFRYASEQREAALFELSILSGVLAEHGLPDTRESRKLALEQCLNDIVTRELARCRGHVAWTDPGDDLDEEVRDLIADVRSGRQDRQLWSLLYHRYLSPYQWTVQALADTISVSRETVGRRLNRSHDILAQRLQMLERQEVIQSGRAKQLRGSAGHAPAPSPIAHNDPVDRASQLLCLAREAIQRGEPKWIADLPEAALDVILTCDVRDLAGYHVTRVANWMRPRHQLDERFVRLTILVDIGEDSARGRWQLEGREFHSLRDILTERSEPVWVLLGSPGAGKSTLLQCVEYEAAVTCLQDTNARTPWLVQLNRFPSGGGGDPAQPRTWLRELWSRHYPNLESLDCLLHGGRLLLLLDGLNELPHTSGPHYRHLVSQWKQFHLEVVAENPSNRIVYSCRNLDYSAPLSAPDLRVPQAHIEPMSDDQVRAFLDVYCERGSDRIWSALEGTRSVDLLRIPFFARLLAEQAAAGTPVAPGRAALLTGFVRSGLKRELERDNPLLLEGELLSDRDLERAAAASNWRTPHELPERGPLFPSLAQLAYASQEGMSPGSASLQRIDYDAALSVMSVASGNAIKVAIALSILDEDRDNDSVFFCHQLLQEYFAARWYVRSPDWTHVATAWRADEIEPSLPVILADLPIGDPMPSLATSGWEDTILIASALAGSPDAFVETLSRHDLELAGRCAAQPDVAQHITLDTLKRLRQGLVQRSSDPAADLRARIAAGRALGQLGDPRFLRMRGLGCDYLVPPMVRIEAADYRIGEDEAYVYLGSEARGHMPSHSVSLDTYSIARFPVTNAEWKCFLNAGGYDDEQWWPDAAALAWRSGEGTANGSRLNTMAWRDAFAEDPSSLDLARSKGEITDEVFQRWQRILAMSEDELEAYLQEQYPRGRKTTPAFWEDSRFNNPAQPVVGICWYEARAYARWLSAQSGTTRYRLPTEVEWEAAARGASACRYAVGDEYDSWKGNVLRTRVRCTTPVGVFVANDQPSKIADLMGNVWEWTSSAWGPDAATATFAYPYRTDDGREDQATFANVMRVVRGGSWVSDEVSARAPARNKLMPDYRFNSYGMRLVADDG